MSVRRLDLVKKSSAEDGSEPLRDMARVGSKAAIHNVHAHASRSSRTINNSDPKPATSSSSSRRASRVEEAHRGPQIVIDSPPPEEESLYPSLTTLGSFDDEDEDEFSCKECCKSGIVECVE